MVKRLRIIESVATISGCDRGGLHSHALLLAHCRKDKSILWNFKKLFRAYFNNRNAKDSLNMDDLASVATVNVTKALPLFKSTTPSIGQIVFDISRTKKMDAPTWSQKMKRWVGVKDIEITTTTAHDVQNISSVPRHMVISSESEVEDQPLRWKVRTKLKKKLLKRKISNDVLKENGEKKRPRMMSSGNLSSGSVQSNPPMQMQQTRQSQKDRPLLI